MHVSKMTGKFWFLCKGTTEANKHKLGHTPSSYEKGCCLVHNACLCLKKITVFCIERKQVTERGIGFEIQNDVRECPLTKVDLQKIINEYLQLKGPVKVKSAPK